ncbi:hypothetical protein HpCOL17_07900 [Helicobacter pylori]
MGKIQYKEQNDDEEDEEENYREFEEIKKKALHSVKLDLLQKGFDDFNDATFNKIYSLNKEFSEQERSQKREFSAIERSD